MGMFDDNGPFQNMIVNTSFFGVPSSQPPQDIALASGIVGMALLGTLAVVGAVAYVSKELSSATLPPVPATAPVEPSVLQK